ncbi:MAG: hypothetical protein BroJett030_14050 [Alphaproteobacteria bacterium]|nr:MAG: hypothetical protein BroJett030_14050 [Alphaproteobacteria bacterium]
MVLVGWARDLYVGLFAWLERLAADWLLGLAARFAFLAVLYFYFLASWKTKTGPGLLGAFRIEDNAYYQIVPWAVEAAGGDIAELGLASHLIVFAGTMAELILPALIVAGLFTRAAALGMIVFVIVQSWVDIRFHGVDAQTAGAWFDRFSDSLIADQRLLWGFLLLFLAVKGAGAVSLDHLLKLNPAERHGEADKMTRHNK